MQTLIEFLAVLTPSERDRLRATATSSAAIPSSLILNALDKPDITANQFIGTAKITHATYNKSLSLALSTAYEVLSQSLVNPYDHIFLVRELVIRGLGKQAKHLYGKLEKEYEEKQLYPQLNALYHEGSRICYHTGDKRWLAALRKKVDINSARLARYNTLDKSIMASMLELVRKPTKSTLRLREIQLLKKQTLAFGHPVLIHNALTAELSYYTSTAFDLQKAFRIVSDLNDHVVRNRQRLEEYSYTLARYNYSKFVCDYLVDHDAEPYYDELISRIGSGGTIEVSAFYVNYFFYFLAVGKTFRAREVAERLFKSAAQDRLSYLRHYVAAWLAWIDQDFQAFGRSVQLFYATPDCHDSPINDFYIRALELIVAVREKSYEFAYNKAEALKKFSYRSLPTPQKDFTILVGALQRFIQSHERPTQKTLRHKPPQPEIASRIVRYLYDYLTN